MLFTVTAGQIIIFEPKICKKNLVNLLKAEISSYMWQQRINMLIDFETIIFRILYICHQGCSAINSFACLETLIYSF